jgi:hypothetical protein
MSPHLDPILELIKERNAVIEERNAARDCGQEGVCATPPGCQRHWEERNRELVRERDEARDLADSYRIAFCSANGMDKTPTPFPWEESK